MTRHSSGPVVSTMTPQQATEETHRYTCTIHDGNGCDGHCRNIRTRPASEGEMAEYRHLLYDADADASTPAFRRPTPIEETSTT